MAAFRIFIADDHEVVRKGLCALLQAQPDWEVCGEAADGREAVEKAQQMKPDVVILDISMPGRTGLDILDEVKRLRPRTPVLLLTMHPEQQYARRALKAGAAGYLTKDSVPDELKSAIKKIVAGGRYVSATLAEKLAVDLRQGADLPLHELLSDREFQILRMLASGKTVKEMAEELRLSVKTVSTYRARILEKSGMKTNAELIRYALEAQLVD